MGPNGITTEKTGRVNIESADLKPYHALFNKLQDQTIKLLMPRCHLVRLSMDQMLYRQGDISNGCGYLIVFGMIELSNLPSS